MAGVDGVQDMESHEVRIWILVVIELIAIEFAGVCGVGVDFILVLVVEAEVVEEVDE